MVERKIVGGVNSSTEHFFSNLKYELLTGNVYQTIEPAITDTLAYVKTCDI